MVSDILAGIALGLSLFLSIIEIRRRFYVLHFEVTDERLIDVKSNTGYLLIGLSIYNPSTMPKTVYQIDFQPLEGFHICEVKGEQNFEQETVTFQSMGSSNKVAKVRLDDTASPPLDVEPLHSKTVYLAIAVSPVYPLPPSELRLPIQKHYGYLIVSDYRHGQTAKIPLMMPQ